MLTAGPWLQVMPVLRAQTAESLLKELQWRWTNHRVMVRWLSKFFNYLDRCCPELMWPLPWCALCTALSRHSAGSCLADLSHMPSRVLLS